MARNADKAEHYVYRLERNAGIGSPSSLRNRNMAALLRLIESSLSNPVLAAVTLVQNEPNTSANK